MEVSRKRKRYVASHVEDHVETTLSGRREEMDSIRSFLSSHVKKQRPGSLFITGPPGTGKTASINAIFKSDTVSINVKNVEILFIPFLCKHRGKHLDLTAVFL